MKIIKFGGTAFQTPKLVENVCNIIKKEEKPLLVVVSAIGRRGFPFATDTLIDSIKENHLSNKEYDRLLSLGEIYSSLYLSNALNRNNVKTYALSYLETGIECNDNYSEGNILCISNENIEVFSKNYDVIILPGFIGNTKEKEVITLGRGTSDLSAVEMAIVYKEKEVTLYKDVNGIFPTMFINLMRIEPYEYLSYDEVCSLINIGISPINEKALIEAKRMGVKIIIKNFVGENKGTIVSNRCSNREIVGFNIDNNRLIIATLDVNKYKEKIIEILKTQHVYVKEDEYGNDYFVLRLNGSQMLLARQILIKNYFFDMLK